MPALPFPVVLTYGLLAFAVLSLWLPPLTLRSRQLDWWPWALGLALVVAMGASLVTPIAALALAGYGLLGGLSMRMQAGWGRTALIVALSVIALALALHLVPGFVNPPIVTDLRLTPNSALFTHRLNFDTAAAGIVLCGALCRRIHDRAGWAALAGQWKWIVGPALVVNLLALMVGYALFEPKLPAYAPYYLAINLLFTCVTEEAFFRGVIQQRLSDALGGFAWGKWIALGVASVLFGLAHARGGLTLAVLATVAGIGYGLAYQRSGRIEAAIGAHIALNGLHFLMLSYPRAI